MHASFEAIFGLLMWLDNETLHLHCTYNNTFIAASLCLARCCYIVSNMIPRERLEEKYKSGVVCWQHKVQALKVCSKVFFLDFVHVSDRVR